MIPYLRTFCDVLIEDANGHQSACVGPVQRGACQSIGATINAIVASAISAIAFMPAP
jgi:hypothetical protein